MKKMLFKVTLSTVTLMSSLWTALSSLSSAHTLNHSKLNRPSVGTATLQITATQNTTIQPYYSVTDKMSFWWEDGYVPGAEDKGQERDRARRPTGSGVPFLIKNTGTLNMHTIISIYAYNS